MEKKGVFTIVLAITGAVLVWLPILFMLITSLYGTISAHTLRFDYLIPAELFPAALTGTLLLLWAALWARSHQKHIAWGLGAMVVFLFGGMALASISGLASGAIEPAGPAWAIVVASIAIYSLALIWVCITAVLLLRKLYFSKRQPSSR